MPLQRSKVIQKMFISGTISTLASYYIQITAFLCLAYCWWAFIDCSYALGIFLVVLLLQEGTHQQQIDGELQRGNPSGERKSRKRRENMSPCFHSYFSAQK